MQWTTNKLADLKKIYVKELCQYYDRKEAESLINILIKDFFNIERSSLVMNPDLRLSESEILKLHFGTKDLKKYKPVQYIVQQTDFLNTRVIVNENVLIPRPETEELVSLILSREKETKGKLRVLDVGTGSGCIAITLQKNLLSSNVYGTDISADILKLAKENAVINNTNVKFLLFDILKQKSNPDLTNLDIIVSNPPYVTFSEKGIMKKNVLEFEPHQALFVPDDDPLLFYRVILQFSGKHLKNGGRVYFEINEKFGNEVVNLTVKHEFRNVELLQDINGKDRFVFAIKS
jgi:release factor glutamine methyltransferase